MSMWVLMRKGCILTLVPNIPSLPILTVKLAVSRGSLKVLMVRHVLKQTVMTHDESLSNDDDSEVED